MTSHAPRREPLIEARGVVKRFGGAAALDGVDFDLQPGEIHALLGENGAGKSTLIKVLAGVFQRDGGEIAVQGHQLPISFTHEEAARAGLAFVHQDLGLLDNLSVAENLALAVGYPRRCGLISYARTASNAAELLDRVGVEVSPRSMVGDLAQDQKVMVATARALSMNARAIVLDEVSSSLPMPEVRRLTSALMASRNTGVGYVYVTHRLDEVFGFADRVTVLRDGGHVATARTADVDHDQLVEWILGSAGSGESRRSRRRSAIPRSVKPALEVRELLGPGLSEPANFTAEAGQILAFCGLVGCGARELAALLSGAARPDSGSVTLGTQTLPLGKPVAMRRAGCTYVPGDRQVAGGIFPLSVRENLFLTRLRGPEPTSMLRWPPTERREANALADRYGVLPRPSAERTLAMLSGGNQQKVIVARALRSAPALLIVDDPTAGVDVGAREQLHESLRAAADAGAIILMASTDFDEVAAEADRAFVMVRGALRSELSGDALTAEALARASYVSGQVAEVPA